MFACYITMIYLWPQPGTSGRLLYVIGAELRVVGGNPRGEGLSRGGGGGVLAGYLAQVWVPTVERTLKAVAVKAETEER